MLKKISCLAFALAILLVWTGAETSATRRINFSEPSALSFQNDCSDSAIRSEIIQKLKEKFAFRQRRNQDFFKENFLFDVVVKDKVVTLKGYVSGERLRDSVLDNARTMIRQMNCGARLNRGHENDNKKDKFFRNHDRHSCPAGQVECPDGRCERSLSACEIPFRG